jgi:lysophospholipase L1-like esterase
MAKASVAPARPESIVALGDSVATGYRCGCDAFIKLVGTARAAAEHRGVRTTNRARDGLTSAGLVQQLDDADVSMATGTADVDVVTIGANDFDPTKLPRPECARSAALACYDAELVELHANLTTVVRRLAGARPRPEARIVLTGYWNVFLDGAVGRARGAAYVTNSDALTRRVNGVIRDVAAQEGALYADVYAAFKAGDPDDTRLLLPDGDHPNAAGHRVIADAVDAALGPAAG